MSKSFTPYARQSRTAISSAASAKAIGAKDGAIHRTRAASNSLIVSVSGARKAGVRRGITTVLFPDDFPAKEICF
jgi:hypothetical protein